VAEDEEDARELDPHKPTQITVVGKKGSGKTELAYLIFESYPFDRVLVDPNHDIKVPEDTEDLEDPVPTRWPGQTWTDLTGEKEQKKFKTFRYIPDFGSPDYLDELDRAVGLAYSHPRTMLFVDECHEAAPAGRTPPHMRRALRQGRHRQLSMILATPRPVTVDPLVISQADWVYVFKLPNPNDRKRVAETIGWDPKVFDEAVFSLGEYEYLRFDSARDDLAHFPAIPKDLIKHHRAA
jgi:hypothetical protein